MCVLFWLRYRNGTVVVGGGFGWKLEIVLRMVGTAPIATQIGVLV